MNPAKAICYISQRGIDFLTNPIEGASWVVKAEPTPPEMTIPLAILSDCKSPHFLSSKDGEHWPVIGEKYLIYSNGYLQEEIYTFDQGDADYVMGEHFWSRDDVDECPLFDPKNDKWLPLSSLCVGGDL